MIDLSRAVAIAIGVASASLSAYGAFEMQHGLEGGITYLTIAAPFVVATAAIIPPLAEATWRQGAWIKAILWWGVLIPSAVLAFMAARERVQIAKGGAAAERVALHGAATRAEQDLQAAKDGVRTAEADEKAARDLKKCREECRAKWEAATEAAREREAAANAALTVAQSKDIAAPEEVPAWLLPACLDLVAFMAIWTGFAPRRPAKLSRAERKAAEAKAKEREQQREQRKRRLKRNAAKKPEPKTAPNIRDVTKRAENDNVVYLPAA